MCVWRMDFVDNRLPQMSQINGFRYISSYRVSIWKRHMCCCIWCRIRARNGQMSHESTFLSVLCNFRFFIRRFENHRLWSSSFSLYFCLFSSHFAILLGLLDFELTIGMSLDTWVVELLVAFLSKVSWVSEFSLSSMRCFSYKSTGSFLMIT